MKLALPDVAVSLNSRCSLRLGKYLPVLIAYSIFQKGFFTCIFALSFFVELLYVQFPIFLFLRGLANRQLTSVKANNTNHNFVESSERHLSRRACSTCFQCSSEAEVERRFSRTAPRWARGRIHAEVLTACSSWAALEIDSVAEGGCI